MDSLVPDVLDELPDALLQVSYGILKVEQGNELTPNQVAAEPSVTWEAEPDTFYTLCMTDPDALSRRLPIFREVNHWMVVNILGSEISKGQVMAMYRGSGPPRWTGLHRYVFLLYKQPSKIDFTEPFISHDAITKRMRFSTRRFAHKYSLGKPIAANMFQSQYQANVG